MESNREPIIDSHEYNYGWHNNSPLQVYPTLRTVIMLGKMPKRGFVNVIKLKQIAPPIGKQEVAGLFYK